MTLTYSQARRELKSLLDRACLDHVPVRITRRHGGDAFLVSADDFAALEETAYLLRSPANARRLLDALDFAQSGQPGVSLDEAVLQLGLTPGKGRRAED